MLKKKKDNLYSHKIQINFIPGLLIITPFIFYL